MDLKQLELGYYILVILAFIIGSCFRFKMQSDRMLAVIFILALSILIGSRPYDITIDTANYWKSFIDVAKYGVADLYSNLEIGEEPILYFIFLVTSWFGTFNTALWVISIISLSLIYYSFERLCKLLNDGSPLLMFLIYLGSFYIIGQQYHIMRAGLAVAFILNALISLYLKKWRSFAIYSIIAVFTHVTALIPLLCGCIVRIFNIKQRVYYILFFAAIMLSALNFGFHSLGVTSYIAIEKVQNYLMGQDTDRYSLGFRLSFVIFNSFYFFFLAKFYKTDNILSLFYFRLYILLSIVLFLSFHIPFFDRIGGFSWNIMPIVTYIVVIQHFKNNKTLAGGLTFIATLLIAFVIPFLSGNS